MTFITDYVINVWAVHDVINMRLSIFCFAVISVFMGNLKLCEEWNLIEVNRFPFLVTSALVTLSKDACVRFFIGICSFLVNFERS